MCGKKIQFVMISYGCNITRKWGCVIYNLVQNVNLKSEYVVVVSYPTQRIGSNNILKCLGSDQIGQLSVKRLSKNS